MLNPNASGKLQRLRERVSVDIDVTALLLVRGCDAFVDVGQSPANQHLGSAHCHFAKPHLVLLDAFLLRLRVAFGHAAVDVILLHGGLRVLFEFLLVPGPQNK